MLGKLTKYFGWTVAVVLSLGLVAYAVLFVTNLKDQPPAAEIAVLKSLQNSGSPFVSEDNSYLFMLGFSGPPDADPVALGLERYEWMELAKPDFEIGGDPLSDDYNFRSLRSESVAALAEWCSDSEIECLQLLETDQETVIQWLADEGWLLDRYRTLTAMTEFREILPFEVLAKLPSYHLMFDGQRLMIADAWQSALDGDAEAVRSALGRDLIYWRMVLEKSDILITKMFATSAITRHFKLGNLVIRQLPEESMAAGVPASWRMEISMAERSMKRCLAGEWSFFDASTRSIGTANGSPFRDWTGVTDSTTWDRFAWLAIKPFWQHQDSSNHHARLMLDLGNAFDVPYSEVAMAVEVEKQLKESTYRRFSRLYNFTGDLVMTTNYWSASDYALRVTDLEGVRRAALLAADLRAAGVTEDDVVQYVLASEIVDPYTNEPFAWYDDSNSIVFHGLEPHDRSRHTLIF